MATENGGNSEAVRLTTWKEIASFLGRDESTVKRWEASRGLPVRRVPGSGRASVFAYAHELQSWLDGETARGPLPQAEAAAEAAPSAEPHRRRRWWVGGIAAGASAAVLIAGTFYWMDYRRDYGGGGTRDAVAAEYYRSGLHEWQTRSPSGLMRAANDFNNAIHRDPNYAQAYVGLADTYNLLREYTAMPADIAYARARAAAQHAIALDPDLAGAHAALGFTDFYWRHNVKSARREFSRALELDPNSATTHHWYATVLMTIGDHAAALSEIEKAAALDAESAAILADKGLILFQAGEVAKSVALLKQLEADQPSFASPHLYLSLIALRQGNDRQYLNELNLWARARHDNDGQALVAAGLNGLSKGGHTGMLHGLLARRLALYEAGRQSAYAVAETYAMLGERKNALAYLAISFARHEPEMVGARSNYFFAPLRHTPEFTRLLTLFSE